MVTPKLFEKYKNLLSKGLFGIEKENTRVTRSGELALTPHPQIFGDKGENRYITTDFSESQIEMITPPLKSIEQAYNYIYTLHGIVSGEIAADELLWCQSLPPLLPASDMIPIARYKQVQKSNETYRDHIAKIYGKERQMICGIHFNLSLSDELIDALASDMDMLQEDVRSELYLKITRGILRHRWLMIWLFGRSPYMEDDLAERLGRHGRALCCNESISMRSGPAGYRNREDYILDFSSVEGYLKSVCGLVDSGELSSSKELYLPVRMKFINPPFDKPNYIEVRFLDLDPLDEVGINIYALYSIHILMLYSLVSPLSDTFDEAEQIMATKMHDCASCKGRNNDATFCNGVVIREEAARLLDDIKEKLSQYGIFENEGYAKAMERMQSLVQNPDSRGAITVFKGCQEQGYYNYHLSLSKKYKEQFDLEGYRFWGCEDMEMSTQLLMRAALCRGVEIDILDRNENFIALERDGLRHIVQQASKTSLDNYVSVLAMENKVVTKRMLADRGIVVPKGGEYTSCGEAMSEFEKYRNHAIVIKPKSTNFGLGITILKENDSAQIFESAVNFAFSHDKTVLVEEFILGREFRIFVIDDNVVGVLHRSPASVKGDGRHTISELIDIKNQDPRRGKGYRTPLEKIAKGESERLFLELQGLDLGYVPSVGQRVYLRENSNISTGGDSLDFTDDLHPSYKNIAIRAAKALGARITGVDMMIQNIDQEASTSNYAIIEMNFNPAIHIHCHPYKGLNRRINFKIIEALGY